MIEMLLDWYNGNEAWSNTPLHPYFNTNYKTGESGNYHYIDIVSLIKLLLEENTDMISDKPKTLLLDEIKSQASSRNSASFVNQQLANFVSQARKMNFKLIYTDVNLGAYEKQLREMTKHIIFANPEIDRKDLGLGNMEYPEPLYFTYSVMDIDRPYQKPKSYWISRNTARFFYPLYDTKKRITPVSLKYQNVKEAILNNGNDGSNE